MDAFSAFLDDPYALPPSSHGLQSPPATPLSTHAALDLSALEGYEYPFAIPREAQELLTDLLYPGTSAGAVNGDEGNEMLSQAGDGEGRGGGAMSEAVSGAVGTAQSAAAAPSWLDPSLGDQSFASPAPIPTTSASTASAPSASASPALTPKEEPKPSKRPARWSKAEEAALLEAVARWGNRWDKVQVALVDAGYEKRPEGGLASHLKTVRKHQERAAAGLPTSWTDDENAQLLHLADTLPSSSSSSTNQAPNVDWKAAAPFFPGRTAAELKKQTKKLVQQRKKVAEAERVKAEQAEQARQTREALEAFQKAQAAARRQSAALSRPTPAPAAFPLPTAAQVRASISPPTAPPSAPPVASRSFFPPPTLSQRTLQLPIQSVGPMPAATRPSLSRPPVSAHPAGPSRSQSLSATLNTTKPTSSTPLKPFNWHWPTSEVKSRLRRIGEELAEGLEDDW
ncbi:hypothetical protein JCM10213_001601 [Rhodosporidiobolus nylandii]